VYKQGDKIQLWVNGQLKDEREIPIDNLFNGAGHYTTVGGVNYYGSNVRNMWDGIIDDIRFYNRALSESEIQAIYNHAQ
jgi:hypothetical protein